MIINLIQILLINKYYKFCVYYNIIFLIVLLKFVFFSFFSLSFFLFLFSSLLFCILKFRIEKRRRNKKKNWFQIIIILSFYCCCCFFSFIFHIHKIIYVQSHHFKTYIHIYIYQASECIIESVFDDFEINDDNCIYIYIYIYTNTVY